MGDRADPGSKFFTREQHEDFSVATLAQGALTDQIHVVLEAQRRKSTQRGESILTQGEAFLVSRSLERRVMTETELRTLEVLEEIRGGG